MLFDSPFVSLPVNDRGRDFCIGDLHGCRQMLDQLLTAVDFDPQRDRLFSVGDLIHRGPESAACLCLAEQPWFFPVMGNHEAMQIAEKLYLKGVVTYPRTETTRYGYYRN